MASDFADRLLAWQKKNGRHDLPWQKPRTAYRVWVSEIMLQQTQVATVVPYFQSFMARFPDVQSLAEASQDDVMAAWAGLGYYSRARNLHRAARKIQDEHGGQFPEQFDEVLDLPGIGRSTAGAILAQAFGQRYAILDGNVKRVLSRHEAIEGWPGEKAIERKLWEIAESYTPSDNLPGYTQGIMDLGASVCRRSRPQCSLCPVSDDCRALDTDSVDRYPSPRPRRERPLRNVRMLMIESDNGEVLLVRRPSAGIWGGLWSLPELPEEMSVETFCHQQLGIKVDGFVEVTGLRHGFTHFELDIIPLRTRVLSGAGVMDGEDSLWYKVRPFGTDKPLGLPAPVARILAQEFN